MYSKNKEYKGYIPHVFNFFFCLEQFTKKSKNTFDLF